MQWWFLWRIQNNSLDSVLMCSPFHTQITENTKQICPGFVQGSLILLIHTANDWVCLDVHRGPILDVNAKIILFVRDAHYKIDVPIMLFIYLEWYLPILIVLLFTPCFYYVMQSAECLNCNHIFINYGSIQNPYLNLICA